MAELPLTERYKGPTQHWDLVGTQPHPKDANGLIPHSRICGRRGLFDGFGHPVPYCADNYLVSTTRMMISSELLTVHPGHVLPM
jgi:hypothetical protein